MSLVTSITFFVTDRLQVYKSYIGFGDEIDFYSYVTTFR